MADTEVDNDACSIPQAFPFPRESSVPSPTQSSFYTATDDGDEECDRLSIRSLYQPLPPRIPLSRFNSVHSTPSPTLPTFSACPVESAIAISISNPGSPRLIHIPPSPRSPRGHHASPSNASDESPPSLISGTSEDEGPEDLLEPLPVIPRRSSLRQAMRLGHKEDKGGRPRKKLAKRGKEFD